VLAATLDASTGGGVFPMASIRAAQAAALYVLIAGGVAAAAQPPTVGERNVQLTLERQPLADALSQLASATGLQIVFYSSSVEGLIAPALNGTLTIRAALERLISGSELEYEFMGEHTIAVRPQTSAPGAAPSSNGAQPALPTQTVAPESDASSVMGARKLTFEHGARELEEMIVTARRREESLQTTPVAVALPTMRPFLFAAWDRTILRSFPIPASRCMSMGFISGARLEVFWISSISSALRCCVARKGLCSVAIRSAAP
jgi:hypothetical protein